MSTVLPFEDSTRLERASLFLHLRKKWLYSITSCLMVTNVLVLDVWSMLCLGMPYWNIQSAFKAKYPEISFDLSHYVSGYRRWSIPMTKQPFDCWSLKNLLRLAERVVKSLYSRARVWRLVNCPILSGREDKWLDPRANIWRLTKRPILSGREVNWL